MHLKQLELRKSLAPWKPKSSQKENSEKKWKKIFLKKNKKNRFKYNKLILCLFKFILFVFFHYTSTQKFKNIKNFEDF